MTGVDGVPRQQSSDPSFPRASQILAENENQAVFSVTLIVLFPGNHLDANAMTDKRGHQVAVSAIKAVSDSQCLVTHLAKELVGTVPHPEIQALEPLKFELLTIPENRHENPCYRRRARYLHRWVG
jgi:hypothetical protein